MLGVLFLGYDLLPLFAPPVMFILLLRRRVRARGGRGRLLVLPSLVDQLAL